MNHKKMKQWTRIKIALGVSFALGAIAATVISCVIVIAIGWGV